MQDDGIYITPQESTKDNVNRSLDKFVSKSQHLF